MEDIRFTIQTYECTTCHYKQDTEGVLCPNCSTNTLALSSNPTTISVMNPDLVPEIPVVAEETEDGEVITRDPTPEEVEQRQAEIQAVVEELRRSDLTEEL